MNKQHLEQLTEKKRRLDAHRPLPPELVRNLEEWFRIELTYSSNAIEGNTLSRSETALVVEKGLTVKGKTLQEHLEAISHAEALDYLKELVGMKRAELTKADVLNIHRTILQKIDSSAAGTYHLHDVELAGMEFSPPVSAQVPPLMEEFFEWLRGENQDHPAKIAADAHLKLVTIHPFSDGNGRTARLLMNLLLMMEGYPPAIIRKEEREDYINSLEAVQVRNSFDDYYKVVFSAVERSLDVYLKSVEPDKEGNFKMPAAADKVLRIGELASLTGETAVAIRHWTDEGLLEVAYTTEKGYRYYHPGAVQLVKSIRNLQERERLSLPEIKVRFQQNKVAVGTSINKGGNNG
jgi:Fic family protein